MESPEPSRGLWRWTCGALAVFVGLVLWFACTGCGVQTADLAAWEKTHTQNQQQIAMALQRVIESAKEPAQVQAAQDAKLVVENAIVEERAVTAQTLTAAQERAISWAEMIAAMVGIFVPVVGAAAVGLNKYRNMTSPARVAKTTARILSAGQPTPAEQAREIEPAVAIATAAPLAQAAKVATQIAAGEKPS